MLDRIDIQIEVPCVEYKEISGNSQNEETSAIIRQRVQAARQLQAQRLAGKPYATNAQMSRQDLEQYCRLDDAAAQLLAEAFRTLGMSGRGHDRILKIARTIADLAGAETIAIDHIAEAIQFRSLDREEFNDI